MSLTDQKLKDFKEAFVVFDKDGNGRITIQELRDLMTSVGLNPSQADLKALIGNYDQNKNETLEFNEFVIMMEKMRADLADPNSNTSKQMWEVFNHFDADKNGTICVSELGVVMKQLGKNPTPDELKEILQRNDVNRDGKISYDEFLKLMKLA